MPRRDSKTVLKVQEVLKFKRFGAHGATVPSKKTTKLHELPKRRPMLIGYHYTSYFNWLRICKDGLLPQLMSDDSSMVSTAVYQLKDVFNGATPLCIWVWSGRLEGLSHVGSVLFQWEKLAGAKIVELQIVYRSSEVLKSLKGERLLISHAGCLGNVRYHTSEKAVLLYKRIPPGRVSLLGVYDVQSLLGRNSC